jgi:hypothetical protein
MTAISRRAKEELMKRTTIVGLCLAAICAFCAVAVASASAAQPEFQECGKAAKSGKTYTGKYSNKTCTEVNAKSEGKYERKAPKKAVKFKGTLGGTNFYVYDPAEKAIKGDFVCTGGKNSGATTGASEATLTVSWSGCEGTGPLAGIGCYSPGAKVGTVVSNPLVVKLVWLNGADTEVGVDIQAATAGGPIAKVECGEVEKVETFGSIIGKISPTESVTKAETMTFNASETTGEPEYDGSYEGVTFKEEPLYSVLEGASKAPRAPTSQKSVYTEKSGSVIIAG